MSDPLSSATSGWGCGLAGMSRAWSTPTTDRPTWRQRSRLRPRPTRGPQVDSRRPLAGGPDHGLGRQPGTRPAGLRGALAARSVVTPTRSRPSTASGRPIPTSPVLRRRTPSSRSCFPARARSPSATSGPVRSNGCRPKGRAVLASVLGVAREWTRRVVELPAAEGVEPRSSATSRGSRSATTRAATAARSRSTSTCPYP